MSDRQPSGDFFFHQPPCRADLESLSALAGRVADQCPATEMSPRTAFYAKPRAIPFSQALGCISGEVITPYPLGIPVIMPGERFNEDTTELLAAVKLSRCPISAVDSSLESVRVVL